PSPIYTSFSYTTLFRSNTLKQKIKQIQPSNRNPLYQSHLYWSQKPFNVSRILIEELTNEGDVVFDPFMGSGVSIFESILLDRKRDRKSTRLNSSHVSIS